MKQKIVYILKQQKISESFGFIQKASTFQPVLSYITINLEPVDFSISSTVD